MRYRFLGRSGLKVSELCLGTMTFGEESGFGAHREECRAMFDAYLAAGGNFIDTANVYTGGSSERFLAEFVGAQRSRLVLATKYTMASDFTDINSGGNSRKNLHESLHASLARLRTDYVDLLWVHAWDGVTPLEETMRALDDAVRAGKVLYVGFSNVPAWAVARATTLAEWRGWAPLIALQLHYSLVERTAERELLPCAQALGLAVTAWSPLGGGVLSGKYSADPEARKSQNGRLSTTNWGRMFMTERNLGIAAEVRAVAVRHGLAATQVALAWLLRRAGNVIPIVGARTHLQLVELLGAGGVTLDAEAVATLDAASHIDIGYPGNVLTTDLMRQMLHAGRHADIDGLTR